MKRTARLCSNKAGIRRYLSRLKREKTTRGIKAACTITLSLFEAMFIGLERDPYNFRRTYEHFGVDIRSLSAAITILMLSDKDLNSSTLFSVVFLLKSINDLLSTSKTYQRSNPIEYIPGPSSDSHESVNLWRARH